MLFPLKLLQFPLMLFLKLFLGLLGFLSFLFVGPLVEQVDIGCFELVFRPARLLLINNVAFIGPHNIPQLSCLVFFLD